MRTARLLHFSFEKAKKISETRCGIADEKKRVKPATEYIANSNHIHKSTHKHTERNGNLRHLLELYEYVIDKLTTTKFTYVR